MDEFSILIGGKAGDGINQAGLLIARIFGQLGWHAYIYYDYPSLIRGGHNFSIIRLSKKRISAHTNKINFLLALNQDTVDLHKNKLAQEALVIYNSDLSKAEGIGVALEKIVKEENALAIMRNSCAIGSLCKAVNLSWEVLEKVFRKNISKEIDLNLRLARRGYEAVSGVVKIESTTRKALPLVTGNEAIGIGLYSAGLDTYIAYPMTPSSSLLHFLAEKAEYFGITVIHPESEIGVMLLALGFAYVGKKAAVGTSGGGFCLMTEGLSLSGMAELPVVIILGQRPGPSTGLPTYSGQTELLFALNAAQGEFVRFVAAPGDAEEAYFWAQVALNFAWKFQIPAIILSDKNLSEGSFNFDIGAIEEPKGCSPLLWDRNGEFKRYAESESGISPLTFVPDKDAVIKVNSYEHDEFGITTEESNTVVLMQDKRLRKEKYLIGELENYPTIKAYGNLNSETILLCWGSNKGVCVEVAENLGLKAVCVAVLSPFCEEKLSKALMGSEKIICIENNATGQFVRLISGFGFRVDKKILKYDGRPFSVEELEEKVRKAL
ncbi:MAG: 2-oxoacid:acceptor oxidoreductase subunit alpha [Candidatus Omnitrophota bacterium]